MTTTQYLRAFARFWLLIAVCAVVGFLLPFVVTSPATTTYQAATTVVITTTSAVPPSTSDEYEATLLAHQRMATYAALADSATFAEDVRDGLSTKLSASQVRDRVSVEELPGAVALRVTAKDTDRERAELLAAQGAKTMVQLIGRYEAAKAQPPVLLKARVAPGAARPTVALESSGGRKPWLTGAAGLLVGLALAVALARRDPRLYDPGVVAELAGAPVLGVVQKEENSARYERATDDVRTGIFFLREAPDRCLTVAITGPRPVPRQSQLSSDVAAAMGRTGARVLLVHADLDPAGSDDHGGLAAYLSGTSSLDGVIESDATPGVDVVTSGRPSDADADLLHSKSFDRLLAEASERYDFVLVTAPATSRGTGADAVAARCDATVLIVDGHLRSGQLREGLRQLRRVDVRVRGVVLLA